MTKFSNYSVGHHDYIKFAVTLYFPEEHERLQIRKERLHVRIFLHRHIPIYDENKFELLRRRKTAKPRLL